MEIPKIPDSIGAKFFYLPIDIYDKDWELVKKEASGKYTVLKSIIKISDSQIFECEINQNDIQKMHEIISKGKMKGYKLPIFLRKEKGKKYYPYVIDIPKSDFTNDQKRIFSFLYGYHLEDLIGFHPFTKDKSPPYCHSIEKERKNCFAKFYELFKKEIDPEIFDSYFSDFFNVDEYKDYKQLDDFPFLLALLESELKYGTLTPIVDDIILAFKYFKWNIKYEFEKYFPKAEEHLYNDYIKPLYLGTSDSFKKIYSNLDVESKYVVDRLFITYDFQVDNYKYYNDENLISSYLTTLEQKQEFYELYYELLAINDRYKPDFKYKKYFREESINKLLEKYLRYESDTISWRKFDFAGEDQYGTYEGGGGCYKRKGYHVTSRSFRKTKKLQLIYTEYNCYRHHIYHDYVTNVYFYLNKEKTKLPLNSIWSTFSYDNNNIIVTDGSDKPYIYNIVKDQRNDNIILDSFSDKCYDAIMLENKLIVVSGYNMFGYYCENDKNHYKVIHTYKPENKYEKMLIYVIEFNDNLLISCFKNKEKDDKEKEKNTININETFLCFHTMNYNKEEKKLNDENIMKTYPDIKLSKACFGYRNVLAKFTDTILGIGGDTNIYLVNILEQTLVKIINKFDGEQFCSFYLGDFNMVFILTRHSKTINTFDEDFDVYTTSWHSYRFDEQSLELVYQEMPKSKNSSCIIF